MTAINVDLGYRPRAWQQECHANKKRFSVFALHRRAGKTELAIMELIDSALRSQLDLPFYVYMAPFLRQAKAVAWERLKHYARKIPGTSINESELIVTFPNGAKIALYGGDNPDGMRGLRLDGIVIDEVAQIKPEVWNEIVQPALSDRLGWAIFIGTPKGVNLFSELFMKAVVLSGWHSARYTVYDTDSLNPEEVERLRRDMPENEFAREYLCDFSAAAENQLISIAQVEEAAKRHLRSDQYNFAPVILGVDVARFGDDRSVIARRQGLVCFPPEVYAGLDNMEVGARVVQAILTHRPQAVFVDVGAGTGVIDYVRSLGHQVIEVNFGGKSTDPRMVNKRTEMFCHIADWLKQGGAIPDDPALKMELATPTYSHDAQGRKKLEAKDEIKKRIMKSPDIADALALTFAFPVAPPPTEYERMARKPNQCLFFDPEAE